LTEIVDAATVEIYFYRTAGTESGAAVILQSIGGLNTVLTLDITGLADRIPAEQQEPDQKQ